MGRIKLRNTPRLRLTDLLRRRKLTLAKFVNELGITTYEALSIRCDRMGVAVPTLEEFNALGIVVVSSPTEGVVVLDPPPVVEEQTGKPIDEQVHSPLVRSGLSELTTVQSSPQETPKKSKKKKDGYTQPQYAEISALLPEQTDTSQENN